MYACVLVGTLWAQWTLEVKEAIGSLESGVTGSYKPVHIGAGIQTRVLCESSVVLNPEQFLWLPESHFQKDHEKGEVLYHSCRMRLVKLWLLITCHLYCRVKDTCLEMVSGASSPKKMGLEVWVQSSVSPYKDYPLFPSTGSPGHRMVYCLKSNRVPQPYRDPWRPALSILWKVARYCFYNFMFAPCHLCVLWNSTAPDRWFQTVRAVACALSSSRTLHLAEKWLTTSTKGTPLLATVSPSCALSKLPTSGWLGNFH